MTFPRARGIAPPAPVPAMTSARVGSVVGSPPSTTTQCARPGDASASVSAIDPLDVPLKIAGWPPTKSENTGGRLSSAVNLTTVTLSCALYPSPVVVSSAATSHATYREPCVRGYPTDRHSAATLLAAANDAFATLGYEPSSQTVASMTCATVGVGSFPPAAGTEHTTKYTTPFSSTVASTASRAYVAPIFNPAGNSEAFTLDAGTAGPETTGPCVHNGARTSFICTAMWCVEPSQLGSVSEVPRVGSSSTTK